MRIYTLAELFNLTRRELFALHARTVAELAASPLERAEALTLLRRIRRVLGARRPEP